MSTIAQTIHAAVASWPGVTAQPHRFGGVEFVVNHHEIGHLHGDHQADLPFPRRIRDELIEGGFAQPHHVLPQTGWVTFRIHTAAAVPAAIALFRRNYERLAAH